MSGYKGKLTDHILREDAIKALCKSSCYRGPFCPDEYCREVREPLDDVPAADVLPVKHGRWVPVTKVYKTSEEEWPAMHVIWEDATEPDEIDAVRCSECGYVADLEEARNFCTECGACMRPAASGSV